MIEPLRLYKTWRPESRQSINADAFCYSATGKIELSFKPHGDPLYIELVSGDKYNGVWAKQETATSSKFIYFSSGVSDGSPLTLYEMNTIIPITKYPDIAADDDVSVKTIRITQYVNYVVLASMDISDIDTVRISPDSDGIQIDLCFRSNEDAMEWMLKR